MLNKEICLECISRTLHRGHNKWKGMQDDIMTIELNQCPLNDLFFRKQPFPDDCPYYLEQSLENAE